MNNDYPIVNGIAPSWADVIVRATPEGGALVDLKDIAAVNLGITVEVGEQRGASGGRVMKRTTGSVSYAGSITFYRSGFQKFLRALVAAAEAQGLVRGNQRLISPVHFTVQVQHTPFNDVEVYERIAKGCRYLGGALAAAEGTDADQIEVALSPLEVVDIIDGKEVACI